MTETELNKNNVFYEVLEDFIFVSGRAAEIIKCLPRLSKERRELTKVIDAIIDKGSVYEYRFTTLLVMIQSPLMLQEIILEIVSRERSGKWK